MSGKHSREIWKTVPGWPNYEVSDLGRMRSLVRRIRGGRTVKRIHVMTLVQSRMGYPVVRLSEFRNKHATCLVHRLVLEAFVGPCPEGMQARHLDGSRDNNRLENLCWGTQRENEEDKRQHGRRVQGSASNLAKLTASQVLEIRELRNDVGLTYAELSRLFGVGIGTIEHIVQGITWKHLLVS